MQTSRALPSQVSRKAVIVWPVQQGAVRMAVARRYTPSRQLSPAVMASYQPGAPPPAPGPYQPPTGTPVNGAPSPEQPLGLKPAPPPSIFTNIEALVQQTFNSQQPGQRGDWREVEGSWVLYPPSGRTPEAVVHFLGGAFVGAAPQICYRLFLEALSNRNILVVATPYSTSFDHLRIADEAQFKFDRTLRVLGGDVARLPIFGVGHSLGGLVHLLISARYAVQRAGNVLLSYNNRPATDTIPFLSPFIAPSARLLGPVLAQLSSSPVRSTMESVLETLRGVSPSIVRQVVPLVEQLAPIYLDVAQGRQEYSPSPEETRGLIKTYYAVPRNLLLRFRDDTIDETNSLVQLLQNSPAVAEVLDLSVRTLPGDHLRPLHQALVDLPPDVARVANNAVATGGSFIGRLAEMANQAGVQQASAPLEELSKAVVNGASVFGGQVGGPVTDGMQGLADEVAAWMGVGTVVVSGTRALPAANMTARPPTAGAVAY